MKLLKNKLWFAVTVALCAINPLARADDKPEIVQLRFEDIAYWKFVEGKTPIPDEIKKLDGKRVEIRGYMMPFGGSDWVKEFLLINALFGCCFGQSPQPNHIIMSKTRDGKELRYYPGLVVVRGTFMAREVREDGILVCLYQMTVDEVAIAPKE